MKLALISVSNKQHILPLTKFLLKNDYNIISTGGTYTHILNNLNPEYKDRIISIENFTGFPEILDGRVKTLNPKIYGGLLYDKHNKNHITDIETNNISPISIIVVNLYPFKEVVNNSDSTESDIIENIDIGGVSLLRAAAKNYKNVISLINPDKYDYFIEHYSEIIHSDDFKKGLAAESFEHVTDYDALITNYFSESTTYRKYVIETPIKYGCNPYQNNAYLYSINNNKVPIKVINGNPGYINYLDSFNSWLLVCEASKSLDNIVATSFKHTAPAGVALGSIILNSDIKPYYLENYDIDEINKSQSSRAFLRARYCDPLSSFGDFIAISGIVDETCAKLIKREISDGIIAEGYTDKALEILKTKKGGKYPIIIGDKNIDFNRVEYKEIMGVSLSQKCNSSVIDDSLLTNIPTNNNHLSDDIKKSLILATITLKYTPSNSITIATNGLVIGIGAGQQNRVDCIKLAGNKATNYRLKSHPKCIKLFDLFKPNIKKQDKINAINKYINNDFSINELSYWLQLFTESPDLLLSTDIKEYLENDNSNLVLSSDAFFPFRDNIDYANKYNIKYILNPGGSIQDQNIIDACNEYGMCMAISGMRLFLH
jgi:phosphoribosylaminoimidazolecarboxamide formyltransferase / IMP cyclohydrolase